MIKQQIIAFISEAIASIKKEDAEERDAALNKLRAALKLLSNIQ